MSDNTAIEEIFNQKIKLSDHIRTQIEVFENMFPGVKVDSVVINRGEKTKCGYLDGLWLSIKTDIDL